MDLNNNSDVAAWLAQLPADRQVILIYERPLRGGKIRGSTILHSAADYVFDLTGPEPVTPKSREG